MQFVYLLSLFVLGWYVYGLVLMFKSDKKCGSEMYQLLYVLFWISVALCGCACCCGCVGIGAMSTHKEDMSNAAQPLLPQVRLPHS